MQLAWSGILSCSRCRVQRFCFKISKRSSAVALEDCKQEKGRFASLRFALLRFAEMKHFLGSLEFWQRVGGRSSAADEKLMEATRLCQEKIHLAILDNFATPKVVEAISKLVLEAKAVMDSPAASLEPVMKALRMLDQYVYQISYIILYNIIYSHIYLSIYIYILYIIILLLLLLLLYMNVLICFDML